jgi:threonyl-tRNA synthetase
MSDPRSREDWDDLLRGLVGPAPALSPLETLRHSTAHVMAKAVQRLFPETRVTVGPSTESGFYYDVDRAAPFTADELATIEVEMQHIVRANEPFVRHEIGRDAARAMFDRLGETYKVELIDRFPPGPVVSYYTTDDWLDLCRGPHLRTTGEIKAFKLLSVTEVAWRSDGRRLQRIAGTAFGTASELEAYLSHRPAGSR